jgi:uncharacterized protein (TIGR02246 family)
MKFMFLFLFLVLPHLADSQRLPAIRKQCSDPSTRAVIQRIIDEWQAGYNAASPEKVAALYADDATYLTQHFASGVVHGRAAIKAYVKKGTDAHYHIDSLDLLTSECSHNFAYAITRYTSTNAGQKAVGFNLVVLKKVGEQWLIVAHESAVPDPATAIHQLEIPPK